jgi:hypothetical protein
MGFDFSPLIYRAGNGNAGGESFAPHRKLLL